MHIAVIGSGDIGASLAALVAELGPNGGATTIADVLPPHPQMWFRRLLDEGRPGSPNEQRLASPVTADLRLDRPGEPK